MVQFKGAWFRSHLDSKKHLPTVTGLHWLSRQNMDTLYELPANHRLQTRIQLEGHILTPFLPSSMPEVFDHSRCYYNQCPLCVGLCPGNKKSCVERESRCACTSVHALKGTLIIIINFIILEIMVSHHMYHGSPVKQRLNPGLKLVCWSHFWRQFIVVQNLHFWASPWLIYKWWKFLPA